MNILKKQPGGFIDDFSDKRNNFHRWYDYSQSTLSNSPDSYLRAFIAGMVEAAELTKRFTFRQSKQCICQDCALIAAEEMSERLYEALDKFRKDG